MDYKVDYLSVAEQDIDDIGAYLSQFYASTFKKFMRSLKKSISHLKTSPYLGVPYRDYRKLVVGVYLVFYKVDEEQKTVRIYRVLHGARDTEIRTIERD